MIHSYMHIQLTRSTITNAAGIQLGSQIIYDDEVDVYQTGKTDAHSTHTTIAKVMTDSLCRVYVLLCRKSANQTKSCTRIGQ